MTHPLQNIAENAPADVKNIRHEALDKDKRVATIDDRTQAVLLAAEIIGTAMSHKNVWRGFAMRIINMTTEGRTYLLDAIKSQKGQMTKANTEFGIEKKLAQKRTNSFATQISELNTITKAWNSGATVTGWREYVNTTMPGEHKFTTDEEMLHYAGYVTLVEYARIINGRSKKGRPTKTYTEKVQSFLEDTKPEEDDEVGTAMYQQLVSLYNSLVEKKK